jgi:hypothetical protein
MKPKNNVGTIRLAGFKAILALLLIFFLASCGNGEPTAPTGSSDTSSPEAAQSAESTIVTESESNEGATGGNPPVSSETDGAQSEAARDDTIYLQIGERTYSAALAANSSAQALKELLAAGSVTIDMRDYGNMEKVGGLGTSLPTNDEQITTEPGDLILYQGNAFVIYYAANSWNFTELGKINDVSPEELKEALGDGNVTVTLSLEGESS